MPSTFSRPGSSVTAAAALQFSVDFDPSLSDSQPSVLLLTQNVGGIEAAYGSVTSLLDTSPGVSPTSDQLPGGTGFPSTVATMTGPYCAQVRGDVEAKGGVSGAVRQQVADFLADLRTWLHRMSYISAAARRAEMAARNAAFGFSTGRGTSSATTGRASSSSPLPCTAASSPQHAGSPFGSNPTAGQAAESFLCDYTPAARPPMVDLIVVHFQEIGGKYKNKQFNQYFKEQLSTVLLPEAGWTSGLLMDERESDRVVVNSSTGRRIRTTRNGNNTNPAAGAAGQEASPTSMTGHLRAPAWDCTDSHSRRSSNDVSGTETDVSEEEVADPYFTAIGSIIFLSPRIMGITSCLSVPHRTYIPVVDDPTTYVGDAGRLFLSGRFSEAGRSRKGFLMVSLRIGTVQFNLCNLHLFNDDDNRVAFEASPSKYTTRRIRAMQEAFAECSAVIDLQEPLFLFGDYNVRMEGKAFVQWAEEKEQIFIRPGKKQLRCPEHLWTFFADPSRSAEFRRLYDSEPQRLMDEVAVQAKVELGEMPVTFAPTYSRIAYHQRSSESTGTNNNNTHIHSEAVPVMGFTEASSPPLKTSLVPNGTDNNSAEYRHSSDELNCTQTPSAVAAAANMKAITTISNSASSSSLPPSLIPAAGVAEPLAHVAASPTRDNFCHDRLPAWCDRVLFNVAGLEWISGGRARPPAATAPPGQQQPQQVGGATVRDRRKAPEASQPRWYAYDAIDFVHMDHDGVYLMF